jgi:hypothetical protein
MLAQPEKAVDTNISFFMNISFFSFQKKTERGLSRHFAQSKRGQATIAYSNRCREILRFDQAPLALSVIQIAAFPFGMKVIF